jgi:hypothetical protein
MKENRLVADSEDDKKESRFERLDQKRLGEKPATVWLKELSRACQKICVNEKYQKSGTRSFPNSMANWLRACPQSLNRHRPFFIGVPYRKIQYLEYSVVC